MFKFKDQLMTYYLLLLITPLTQEFKMSRLKKLKELKDTIFGICIMLYYMQLRIVLMP